MYEYGFNNYKLAKVLGKGTVKELDDSFYKKKVYIKKDFIYPITSKEQDLFKIEYQLQEPKEDWRDKKMEPNVVGKAVIFFNNQSIKEVPLYYKQTKKKEDKTLFENFKSIFVIHMGVKTND
jgi:D-alanyl-D-alanine carboxypeptidase